MQRAKDAVLKAVRLARGFRVETRAPRWTRGAHKRMDTGDYSVLVHSSKGYVVCHTSVGPCKPFRTTYGPRPLCPAARLISSWRDPGSAPGPFRLSGLFPSLGQGGPRSAGRDVLERPAPRAAQPGQGRGGDEAETVPGLGIASWYGRQEIGGLLEFPTRYFTLFLASTL